MQNVYHASETGYHSVIVDSATGRRLDWLCRVLGRRPTAAELTNAIEIQEANVIDFDRLGKYQVLAMVSVDADSDLRQSDDGASEAA